MPDFILGAIRYFGVGAGILALAGAYLCLCGWVYKTWPRAGIVMGAVVLALPFALITAGATAVYFGPVVGLIGFGVSYLVYFALMAATRPKKDGWWP